MNKLKYLITLILLFTLTITANAEGKKKVLCFGDSITDFGLWVAEVGTLDEFETINAGVSGRRASQAVEALTDYLDKYKELDLIIMFLGVNDLPARDKRPGIVKVDGCVLNMNEAIDTALTRFKPEDIILVAPCDVNPDIMNDVNKEKGYDITSPLLLEMERQYKMLAEEKGVEFFSLYNVVSKENYKDGLHPNKEGDAEIAEAVKEYLLSR